MEDTKFRSHFLIALEPGVVALRQKMRTALERSARRRRQVEEAFHVGWSHLRRLATIARDATVATSDKISRQAFVGLGQVEAYLEGAQDTLLRLGRSLASRPRKLQEALRAREHDLRVLLAGSPDAIVVTDAHHRFVEANQKALALFGVSEANMRKFTVDVFFSRAQGPKSEGSGSPFRTKYGRCELRRLDGSLRAAEYRFFANFVPSRHLYKFGNVVAINQYQPYTLRTRCGRSGDPHKSLFTSSKEAVRR